MKSFVFWFLATLIGAGIGYGISWLIGINPYLSIGIGLILGSSAGVTANIHRGEQVLNFEQDDQEKKSEPEASLNDIKNGD